MAKIQQKQVDLTAANWQWSTPARGNKNMAASVTTADGQVACATAVAVTPSAATTNGGYVGVRVNGVAVLVGDGTKVSVACYFSADGGTTAKQLKQIATGDLLYWNGTVAGYQLAVTDAVDFVYDVAS
jgi:hypothetical protein